MFIIYVRDIHTGRFFVSLILFEFIIILYCVADSKVRQVKWLTWHNFTVESDLNGVRSCFVGRKTGHKTLSAQRSDR